MWSKARVTPTLRGLSLVSSRARPGRAGCVVWKCWRLLVVTPEAKSHLPAGNAIWTTPERAIPFLPRFLDHRIGLRALVAVHMVGHMKWGTLIALDMEVRGCEFPRFTRASECTAIEESCDTFGAIAGDSDRRAPGSPRKAPGCVGRHRPAPGR